MSFSRTTLLAAAFAASAAASAIAGGTAVRVTISGPVEFNGINNGPLSGASSGDPAEVSFLLDSSVFDNNPNFPTRGYAIDQSSFSFKINGGAIDLGLQSPFPGGQTPYFVLRDNDPGVDGFFLSTLTGGPIGVPMAQNGFFGAFANNFSVTYDSATLPSLDLLDALGSYDFTGLSVFNWTIEDGGFIAMGLEFGSMEIELADTATVYCQGKVNSEGCTPFLTPDPGAPSLSGGPWNVTANMYLNNKAGIFFYGLAPADLPFQGGTLCVLPPLARTSIQGTGGSVGAPDCSGQMSIDLTAEVDPMFVPGQINVQSWSRDPADPTGFGVSLTNGVQVDVSL